MAILKHYTIDPKTQQYAWKISLVPGIGGGGGSQKSKSSYSCLSGTSFFAGYNSQTVIKHRAKTKNYKVFIIPTRSNGDIGEYWVENKTDTSFVVKNTGSNKTASFDWFLVTSDVIITDELEKDKKLEEMEQTLKNGIGLTPEEKEKISKLEQILEKNKDSILEKSKQEIEKQIKNIKNPVQSVNNKTGAIELKAEDIKTKDGTNLEKFKENFTTQYEDTTNKLNNFGGRNYLINSNFYNGLNKWYKHNESVGEMKVTENNLDIKNNTGEKCGVYQIVNLGLDKNSMYTLSFYAKADKELNLFCGWTSKGQYITIKQSSDFIKYKLLMGTAQDKTDTVVLYNAMQGSNVTITNIKVERGEGASDWNLAPEEIIANSRRLDAIEKILIDKGYMKATQNL